MKQSLTDTLRMITKQNFDFSWSRSERTEAIQKYLDYYRLQVDACEYRYGFINQGNERIFVQSFSPRKPEAIVLVAHGYFDHTGSMHELINYLQDSKYHVVSYDMVGHGLSSGRRARWMTFRHTMRCLNRFID